MASEHQSENNQHAVVSTHQQAIITRICEQLFVDYARHLDFRDYDRFVDLFAQDGALNVAGKLQGKEKIRRAMSRRTDELRSRHVITNIAIDVLSETTASGIAYLSLYRHIGAESLVDEPVMLRGPAAIGHYTNSFKLTVDGWRIASCDLDFAFQDPSHFPSS